MLSGSVGKSENVIGLSLNCLADKSEAERETVLIRLYGSDSRVEVVMREGD